VGVWRRLHNEKSHNLYASPSVITVIKKIRVEWTGHVARQSCEIRGMCITFWSENLNERDSLKDIGVDGRIILDGS